MVDAPDLSPSPQVFSNNFYISKEKIIPKPDSYNNTFILGFCMSVHNTILLVK